jgi:phthiodiolone/phenolphthiodiolone dimycocerosates ketoreductase
MLRRVARTAVPITIDRNFPAATFGDAVKAVHASGVVDDVQMWDQLTSWWPRPLWTRENTPMAEFIPDVDSFPDVFAYAAYAAAVAPGIGTALSSDGLRRGPGELMQTMLSLANITEGQSIFMLGAGEVKQARPFGWKRSEGLARLEDQFAIIDKFWKSDGPITFEGNHWKLDRAWLGCAKRHKPKVWALGGGPKLLDMATTYADGFATMVPLVSASVERWAETVSNMKRELERKGRDPEHFDFGVYGAALLHEDANTIDRALDNPLVRFVAAIMGRINQRDWDKEGIEPAYPRDWHYALKLLPTWMSKEEIDDILSRVSREMSEKTWLFGAPAQVADTLQQYVDAGATWVSIIDLLPPVLEPSDAQNALGRSIEVCRHLKGAWSSTRDPAA